MHDPRLDATHCPTCGKKLNAATASDGSDARVEPGALTICVHCASILVFDDDLQMRRLTDDEWLDFDLDTRRELTRGVEAVHRFHDYLKQKGLRP